MDAVIDALLPIIISSAPGILIALWALLKAKAAESEAQWDDASVKFVEDIAKRIVEKSGS